MVPSSHGRLFPEAVLTGPRDEDRSLKLRKSSPRADWLLKERQRQGLPWGQENSEHCKCESNQTLEPPVGQYLADTRDKRQDDYGVEGRQMLQTAERKPLEEFND